MNFLLTASLLLLVCSSASAEQQVKSGDVKCFVCTSLVTAIEDFVTKNTTLAALAAEVDKTCQKLHISGFCNSYIIPALPQMLNDLIAKIPADKVCQKIKLCPSPDAKFVAQEVDVKSGDVKCFACTTVISAIEGFVTKDTTIAALTAEVNKTCHKLHISSFCDVYVLPFIPHILADLIDRVPPHLICEKIKLCPAPPALAASTALVKPEVKSDVKCFVCAMLVRTIEGFVTKDTTIAALTAEVNKTCHSLHISSFCDAYILPSIPQILRDVVAKLPPTLVCEKISLCPPTFAALPFKTVEERAGDVKCVVCVTVVSAVEAFVTKDTTLAALTAEVNKTCHKLHISSFCDAYLIPFLPQILEDLIDRVPPTLVCQQIKLCPATSTAVVAAAKPQLQSGDVKCFLCDNVVAAVEGFVTKDTTIAALSGEINKVCSKLGVSSFCNSFLLPALPQLLKDLVAKYPPSRVCSALRLCPANLALLAPQAKTAGDIQCFLCENVVGLVEDLIVRDGTINSVTKLVDGACHELNIATFCDALLIPYIPRIITDLVAKNPPSKICQQQLHLCAATTFYAL